jgi:hypothetical protein
MAELLGGERGVELSSHDNVSGDLIGMISLFEARIEPVIVAWQILLHC